VLYHWRDPLIRTVDAGVARVASQLRVSGGTLRGGQALALGFVFVAHAIVADRIWADPMNVGFYFSLALAACLLLCLSALRVEELSPRWVALDRFLGNLSYPVFLGHWLAALALSGLAFDGRHPGGSTLFWSSLLVANFLAYGIHAAVERPIERVRSAIRPR
jgi:peptidoglycan/LPS O-acetylase OafA/YrhL